MGDVGPVVPEQLDRNMWAPEEDQEDEVGMKAIAQGHTVLLIILVTQ